MRVAVVGSGCSGLAATWLLNEYSAHSVDLFESDDRLGGHTNTARIKSLVSGEEVDVDTGFMVFNPSTYPNFLRFARDIQKLPIIETDMSFGVSRDLGAFEWAGRSFAAVFAQASNIFDRGHWLMIWDIIRFNCDAIEYLKGDFDANESIGSYLDGRGYSQSFRSNYLLPMTAAIWSTPPDTAALDFPAATLIRFMHNHHLLSIGTRPAWFTIRNGSRQYIDKIKAKLSDKQLHLNAKIQTVSSNPTNGRVKIVFSDGRDLDYDHVIMATHADTTLRLLGASATSPEKDILSQFEFGKNVAVLHSDRKLMPKRDSTWSAWNYITSSDPKTGSMNVNKVALTYWMNLLQSVDQKKHGEIFVTLNPPFMPEKKKIFGQWEYEHPYMSDKSIAAQSRLKEIQGTRNISYAGAWTKYGFHEDGFTSGLRAAASLGGTHCPFDIQPAERSLDADQVPWSVRTGVAAIEYIRVLVALVLARLFGVLSQILKSL